MSDRTMIDIANAVVADRLAKHLAEHHRLKPRTVKVDDDEPEPAKGGADWAMEAALRITDRQHSAKCGNFAFGSPEMAPIIREAAERHYGATPSQLEHARRLAQERDAARAELRNRCDHCGAKTVDNCYRCGAPQCCPQCCKITKLEGHLDDAVSECERLKAELAESQKLNSAANAVLQACCEGRNPNAPPPAAVDGEDEWNISKAIVPVCEATYSHVATSSMFIKNLVDAICPLFAALRRERDEAKRHSDTALKIEQSWQRRFCALWDAHRNAKDNAEVATAVRKFLHEADAPELAGVKAIEAAEQRAESAEAALSELRAACEWHVVNVYSCWREGDRWKHQVGSGWHDSCDDAILAAHRAAKGEPRA